MKAHIAYLRYLLRHKWFVFVAARAIGVPFWQAVMHDWHKFLPSEWFPYVETFYDRDGRTRYEPTLDFTLAWNRHQKRAPHHWQYWLLTWDRGDTEAIRIPIEYAKEMVADWWGAGRAITGKWCAHEWYEKNKNIVILETYTRKSVENFMSIARRRLDV